MARKYRLIDAAVFAALSRLLKMAGFAIVALAQGGYLSRRQAVCAGRVGSKRAQWMW
jgi:hypothetical protein